MKLFDSLNYAASVRPAGNTTRNGALRLVERGTGDLVWDSRGAQKKFLPGKGKVAAQRVK